MKSVLLLLSVLVFLGCDHFKKVDKKDPEDQDQVKVEKLQSMYADMLAQAEVLRDPGHGWLGGDSCDGMIWAGRYAVSPGVTGVDILAAEKWADEPGRFGRRPGKACWDEVNGDQGSKSTWSRDMFVCGLAVYAWVSEDLAALERHASYGKANNWLMGQPFADGRTQYVPSTIGLLFQLIYGLGGDDDVNRIWPSTYTEGLEDFQAHLQVCTIWLRGEVAGKQGDADALPKKPGDSKDLALLSVSETMYQRLEEHAERVPGDPFYQYALGLYNGDMGPAIDACLAGTYGGYVRCEQPEQCVLAHRIFACGLTLKHLGKL